MKQLPPLNSIRAFETTARLLSFTKASEELNVTAGAVSQQVKALEEYLGVLLFHRKNRGITLTQEAIISLPQLADGFGKLFEGIESIRNHQTNKPLTITLPPTFASRWLMPRLIRFQTLHPEIDVRIDASYKIVDLINDDIDAAIRFGTGNYPNLHSDFLFAQKVIPVCSPELLKRGAKLEDPEDLKNFTLLHCDYFLKPSSQAQPDWNMWLAIVNADMNAIDTNRGLHFAQHDLMVQAAIDGQGIGLIASISAQQALKDGRLVQPFQSYIPLDDSYYFLYPKNKSNISRIQAFRTWLLDEINEQPIEK